jgi:hypothetical protein
MSGGVGGYEYRVSCVKAYLFSSARTHSLALDPDGRPWPRATSTRLDRVPRISVEPGLPPYVDDFRAFARDQIVPLPKGFQGLDSGIAL